jgi:hypothetical protein
VCDLVVLQLRKHGRGEAVSATPALEAKECTEVAVENKEADGAVNEVAAAVSPANGACERASVGLAALDMLSSLPADSPIIHSGPISPGTPLTPPVMSVTISLNCVCVCVCRDMTEWILSMFYGAQSVVVVTHALRLLCGLAQASPAWLARFRLAGG